MEVVAQRAANGGVMRGEGQDSRSASFEQFYQAEHTRVLAVCLALAGTRGTAEDLAQEAFLRTYLRWETVEQMENPGAYLRRIAINLATSRRRRLAAEARAVLRFTARHSTDSEDHWDPGWFWPAVRRLPPKQAQAVALRYADDLSTADIAAVMGCAEGTVRAHLFAARKAVIEHGSHL